MRLNHALRAPLLGALLGAAAAARAAPDDQALAADDPVASAPAPAAQAKRKAAQPGAEPYSVISAVKGLSLHRPMYFFPLSYSSDYHGDRTEAVFQVSVKQELFKLLGHRLYFGYTQKSFWQLYNRGKSSPFRETNYAPELFWRVIPDARIFNHWGADIGLEHESNGQSDGLSRSWNRLYVAPFQAKGKHLAHLKFWWRVPEDEKDDPADPEGDDNPDITDFYGYSELNFSRQIGNGQLISLMGRGNPRTGHGAFSITWSVPSAERYAFYGVTLFSGYGESLIDHDRAITRLSLGIMLAR